MKNIHFKKQYKYICTFNTRFQQISILFPGSLFTIDELQNLNPNTLNITLRVYLQKLIKAKYIIEVGCIKAGRGRPKNVLAVLPLTYDHYNEIQQSNIYLKNNINIVINPPDNDTSLDNNLMSDISNKKNQSVLFLPMTENIFTKEEIADRADKLFS